MQKQKEIQLSGKSERISIFLGEFISEKCKFFDKRKIKNFIIFLLENDLNF